MADIFDPIRIGPLTLANRFARSATWEGMADEKGDATPELLKVMADLGAGGLGFVITGHAFVSEVGKAGIGQLGVQEDARLGSLTAVASTVKERGGKVVLQINHAGANALPREGVEVLGSSDRVHVNGSVCRAMTVGEIGGCVEQFGRAARRAREAGFDGVQVHAAHGYGISQFLSPSYNKRTDSYGGSLENRARYLLRAVAAAKAELSPAMALLVKLNSEDFLESDGFTVAEMAKVAAMLEKAGVDCVELSGGVPEATKGRNPVRRPWAGVENTPFYLDAGRAAKAAVKIPMMLVGGFSSVESAREALNSGCADLVSLSRPLIREPGLVARWASGDLAPSACKRDNGCFKPALSGQGMRCTVRKEGEKY